MPDSAIKTFSADLDRAKALIAHAKPLPDSTPAEKLLRDDVLRSAWMFSVGAMDAFFCDAYEDLIASTLAAKNHQRAIVLPDFVGKIEIPIAAVLAHYGVRKNWKWRMAARQMMATENSLDTKRIRSWFNKFCRSNYKMFNDLIPSWINITGATARLFGIAPPNYTAANQIKANIALLTRLECIIQRRHDCIHTCDRPSSQPQVIDSAGTVLNVVRDVEFIVKHSNDHIDAEFKLWLSRCGFTPLTINKIGY